MNKLIIELCCLVWIAFITAVLSVHQRLCEFDCEELHLQWHDHDILAADIVYDQ